MITQSKTLYTDWPSTAQFWEGTFAYKHCPVRNLLGSPLDREESVDLDLVGLSGRLTSLTDDRVVLFTTAAGGVLTGVVLELDFDLLQHNEVCEKLLIKTQRIKNYTVSALATRTKTVKFTD